MQWYQDYGFNIEIIRMAYERAVDQIGQASFPYIGKILQNWHKMGFKNAGGYPSRRRQEK